VQGRPLAVKNDLIDQKVVILLATRNGAEFLGEQLRSYALQTHRNWELIVSDDFSSDDTVAVLRKFAVEVPQSVSIKTGPGQGYSQNFISLVHGAPDGEFFAYSDQDDIWLPHKLTVAVAYLSSLDQSIPAVYFGRTELIDENGNTVGKSPEFSRCPSFRNALVQNIGGGNTMVFNRAARALLVSVLRSTKIVSHDWWTYLMVTGSGGVAHYDRNVTVKYRQHGRNLVGSNLGWHQRFKRIGAFMQGQVTNWNNINVEALSRNRGLLNSASLNVLDSFIRARQALNIVKPLLLLKSGVYRQNIVETVVLFMGSVFGRL
jgi:glycosyltransferase involved in cell wall biosynthesis